MNDLKQSHEKIKQTSDELKKQQDELKTIVDTFNQEKIDGVFLFIYLILFCIIHFFNFLFYKTKRSDIENLDEKIHNLQNLLVSKSFFFFSSFISLSVILSCL